eukprot:1887269-Pleurochrysis_carterae.AAC.1
MEGSTRGGEVCGLLASLLVVRGPCENSVKLLGVWAVRRDEGANERVESRNSRSGERQRLESAAAQCEPASMQERELREGSMRRCGARGPGAHWPSAAGADPAASSGIQPETTLDCDLCEADTPLA